MSYLAPTEAQVQQMNAAISQVNDALNQFASDENARDSHWYNRLLGALTPNTSYSDSAMQDLYANVSKNAEAWANDDYTAVLAGDEDAGAWFDTGSSFVSTLQRADSSVKQFTADKFTSQVAQDAEINIKNWSSDAAGAIAAPILNSIPWWVYAAAGGLLLLVLFLRVV